MAAYNVYDLCIIGAGLIGSSAARHASCEPNVTVCIVGPDEPKFRKGEEIFGAWFDEGRITRHVDPRVVWAQLATRSIKRYKSLEKRTGIEFNYPVGSFIMADKRSTLLADVNYSAIYQGKQIENLSDSDLRNRFPFMRVFDNDVAVNEATDVGYINPRLLREAELRAARLQGCDFVNDIAIQVKEQTNDRPGSTMLKVVTQRGTVVYGRKVLVAVGAFSDFYELFPPGIQPDLAFAGETVLFAELGQEDLHTLRKMPSIVYAASSLAATNNTESDRYRSYILPPIRYPDGKTYLKVGHGPQYETVLTSPREIVKWYIEPPPEHVVEGLKNIVLEVFPGLSPLSYRTDTCVTTRTPSHHPYIDMVTPTLGVALGGMGRAGKSCDEIGKIAADMILSNSWKYDIPKDRFKVILRSGSSKL